MTGWRLLISTTVRLANGTRLRRRPAEGRLLLEPAGPAPPLQTGRRAPQPADYVRGVLTGAWALSAEICQACGGQGDPVTLGSSGRGTRCADCRESSDQVLPRPAWRRERENGHEAPGLLEDLVGPDNLADLMEARPPRTHPGRPFPHWPLGRAQGDPDGLTVSTIGGTGWNHLLRAGFALLLLLECPGVAPPLRLSRVKERLGRLRIYHFPHTSFYEGIENLLSDLSATTCIHCGRPGRLRNHPTSRVRQHFGWIRPACDQCWALPRIRTLTPWETAAGGAANVDTFIAEEVERLRR